MIQPDEAAPAPPRAIPRHQRVVAPAVAYRSDPAASSSSSAEGTAGWANEGGSSTRS